MLKTQFDHHESLLTQLLLTGSLVLPVATLTVKATREKIRTRNRNAQGRKEGTR
jgi:hypothetical protein